MTDKESARLVAERFIDYQARTSAEVRGRLTRGGFADAVVSEVVSDLERAGILDDSRFSADWVESRARSKGFGPGRLSAELRRKGVHRDLVEAAVGALDEDAQIAAAVSLAQKRLKTIDPGDPSSRRKLAGYLQRRGYSWDSIEQVFALLFPNNE